MVLSTEVYSVSVREDLMADDTSTATRTRYSIIGVLFLAWVLGLLIGWIDLTDLDFQKLQLIGITLIVVGGIECLNAATDRHHSLLERIETAENQNSAQLQQMRNDLESLAAEIAKVRKQQVRNAIALEAIVAGMPVSGDGDMNQD
jgi:hypothetical protein